MLTEERYAMISEIIEKERSVTVHQLMEALDASESTIRRDLNAMDASGLLIKVHGGAISNSPVFRAVDENVINRKHQNEDEKMKIAKYAATLIKPNDFVYIDAGTTTELMIDFIKEKNVCFVTNAIDHAKKLCNKGYCVYILGGELKTSTEAIVGEEAVIGLDKYNFTKGFWGTNGISVEKGFLTPEVKEAMIKKKSMENCRECYVLADSSKFSQISSVKFAEFDSATIITTNLNHKKFKNNKEYKNIMEVK